MFNYNKSWTPSNKFGAEFDCFNMDTQHSSVKHSTGLEPLKNNAICKKHVIKSTKSGENTLSWFRISRLKVDASNLFIVCWYCIENKTKKSKATVLTLHHISSRDQPKPFHLPGQKNISQTPKIHKSILTSTNVDKETETTRGESENWMRVKNLFKLLTSVVGLCPSSSRKLLSTGSRNLQSQMIEFTTPQQHKKPMTELSANTTLTQTQEKENTERRQVTRHNNTITSQSTHCSNSRTRNFLSHSLSDSGLVKFWLSSFPSLSNSVLFVFFFILFSSCVVSYE
jgi:hypothetical protein